MSADVKISNEALMDAKDVRRILKVSLPLVYKLADQGRLPCVRIPCLGNGTAKPRTIVRFKAEDDEGHTAVYTDIATSGDYDTDDTYKVEKANISINYTAGNESTATLIAPATFVVQIYDSDRSSYNFTTGESPLVIFNVTNKNGIMQTVNSTYANESGYAEVTFLPDSDFNSGNKTWYAYVASDEIRPIF